MMRLKELRIQAGLSQMQLAKILGCSQRNISIWETGKTIPTMKSLKRLAVVFQCRPEDIYTFTPRSRPRHRNTKQADE